MKKEKVKKERQFSLEQRVAVTIIRTIRAYCGYLRGKFSGDNDTIKVTKDTGLRDLIRAHRAEAACYQAMRELEFTMYSLGCAIELKSALDLGFNGRDNWIKQMEDDTNRFNYMCAMALQLAKFAKDQFPDDEHFHLKLDDALLLMPKIQLTVGDPVITTIDRYRGSVGVLTSLKAEQGTCTVTYNKTDKVQLRISEVFYAPHVKYKNSRKRMK